VRRIIAVEKEPKKSCHLGWLGKRGDDPHQINTGFMRTVEQHSGTHQSIELCDGKTAGAPSQHAPAVVSLRPA
jgi:hypothetical protein